MSARSKGLDIQAEYADKRKRSLNKRDDLKIQLVKDMITKYATQNNIWLSSIATNDLEGWEVIYRRISAKLKTANLTINLSADRWFTTENKYETYATTYQREVVKPGEKNVLKTQYAEDGKTVIERADVRLAADQKVTLPDSWKDASILHPQRRRIYKAMSTTGGKDYSKLTKADLGDGKVGYEIDNRHFNPHSKQVFAALNYANRRHGSSIAYGFSHIVLQPELKHKAIYFPGDTFGVQTAANAVDRQCTYETLGGVLGNAEDPLKDAIWQSCYVNHPSADTAKANLLLEAHIFQEVKMSKDILALYLARETKKGDMSAAVWAAVLANAKKWCKQNNVMLFLQSAW